MINKDKVIEQVSDIIHYWKLNKFYVSEIKILCLSMYEQGYLLAINEYKYKRSIR